MRRAIASILFACAPTEVPVSAPPPSPPMESALPPAATTPPPQASPAFTTPSGLRIEELRAGSGAEARPGSTVAVHYTGTLESGREFDSSRKRGQPISFVLGASQVIKGWDEGIAGMREGQMRRLIIPPELAYGSKGRPPTIPPSSTLVFEVELLEVR